MRECGLEHASDDELWNYARANEFVIVTKDTDFHQRCFLYGPPPKVVWLRLGNCSTATVESVLRARVDEIKRFHDDESASLLVLA